MPAQLAGAPPQVPRKITPVRPRGVGVQPLPQLAAGELVEVDLEAALDLRLGAGEGGEEPVAQHPELQVVEERVHLVAVPRLHREVLRADLQRDGAVELGEPAVLHAPTTGARAASRRPCP